MNATLSSLSAKTKALSVGASILTLATLLGSAQSANAATFNFSFNNEDGPVPGTVSGTVELPDGDGTFGATGLIVTSAPDALGYTLPFDVLANLTNVQENSFTVIGGAIDIAVSRFSALFSPADNPSLGSSFGLNSTSFIPGSSMSIQLSESPNTGVIDGDSSTLIKDGWTILADSYFLRYEDAQLYADLLAEKTLLAEQNNRRIVVEVKSFIAPSPMRDFELALGQYIVYRDILDLAQKPYEIYLAVRDIVFERFFQRKSIKAIVQRHQLQFIIFNAEKEEIVSWTNSNTIES